METEGAFSVAEDDVIDEVIQDKWNAIQKVFRDHSLQIMPRNQKMVKNYCAVGCRCMERDTPATKYAPLDYAFSQKILPTINGNGRKLSFADRRFAEGVYHAKYAYKR